MNCTLCFSQEQAAAVYALVKNSEFTHFISLFIGRLDDRGEDGMDLIKNILKMYNSWQPQNRPVKVLAASTRNLDHIYECLKINCDAITIPLKVLDEWTKNGLNLPDSNFTYDSGGKKPIEYKNLELKPNWQNYNIAHELTDVGLDKFASDWNNLIQE